MLKVPSLLLCGTVLVIPAPRVSDPIAPIRFELQRLPFQRRVMKVMARNTPETMLGGVAITAMAVRISSLAMGANIATLKKDSPKYQHALFRNEGQGNFTEVAQQASLAPDLTWGWQSQITTTTRSLPSRCMVMTNTARQLCRLQYDPVHNSAHGSR